MATYTKVVDPNGGGDYTSLSAWEAGEQGLYVSGDTAIAECRRTGASVDSAACIVEGWTAGVIPRITVHADYRHEGKWADTRTGGNYVYRLDGNSAGGDLFAVFTPNARADGLLVRNASTTRAAIRVRSSTGIVVSGTIGRAAAVAAFEAHNLSGTCRFENCIAYESPVGFRREFGTATAQVYNCTSDGGTYGVQNVSGAIDARNTVATNASTACFSGTFAAASTNNASGDATAPGTSALHGIADPYIDRAGADYHLASGAALIDAGADLSGTFTTDVDGQTRAAPWDIGADEYVVAGVNLTATGAGEATGAASLSLEKPVTATGAGEAAGSGSLSAEKLLAGSGTGEGSGSASLGLEKPLAGAASAEGSGAGSLAVEKPLAATGAGEGAGTATLTVASTVELQAAGAAEGSGEAALTVEKRLGGSGAAEGNGTAALAVERWLAGSATAEALGLGTLSLEKLLSGAGAAEGSGAAALQVGVVVPLPRPPYTAILLDMRTRAAIADTRTRATITDTRTRAVLT